jgi:hypothetical protein
MRRLAPRLFTLCSALSLVLCVAVCAAWVLSFTVRSRNAISFHFLTLQGTPMISWHDGSCCFSRITDGHNTDEMDEPAFWDRTSRYLFGDSDGPWYGGPYYTSHRTGAGDELYQCVVVPCWTLAAPFAILPTAWGLGAIALRVRRRPVPGTLCPCPGCGYDLRATPERCPECGTTATT